MVSVWRVSLLAGVAAGSAVGGSMLMAHPAPPLPNDDPAFVCVKGGEGVPNIDPLRVYVPWQEVEGEWKGVWTPVRDDPGHYTANWRTGKVGSYGVAADIRLSFTGNMVKVLRTQAEGQCHYRGTVLGDGWRVSGTYFCDWHKDPMPWSAAIGPGYRMPPAPACGTKFAPQLAAPWRETEGAWRGDWQPQGGTGAYRAHWLQPTESASANLQITITGTDVSILRSEARGQCHYTGFLTGNRWSASGTYRCDWDNIRDGRHPWSAVIGNGSPPPVTDGTSPLPSP